MRPSTSAVLVVVALGSEERVGLSFAVALSLAIVLFVGSNIVSRVHALHAHRGFQPAEHLALWDKPEHSPEPPSDAPPLDEAEEADPVAEQEATIASLALFGLQTLPSTEAAINEAFKKAIRKVHPDRHFGSQAATEHSRMLLEARAILKKALIIDGDLSSQQ